MVHKANYLIGEQAAGTRLDELLGWIDDNADTVLNNPANGLEAIGVGKKNADRIDSPDGEWCITGFVKKKLTKTKLKRQKIEPFAAAAGAAVIRTDPLKDVEMDVVEAGSAFSSLPGLQIPVALRGQFGGPLPNVDLQKRFDALRSGIGITNPVGSYPRSLSVGTLGFVVRDQNNVNYLVSNNHVIGGENAANVGDAIVQPGTLDLTLTELQLMRGLTSLRNRLQIAELSALVNIDFVNPTNEVDAAIAEINGTRDVDQLDRIGLGSSSRGIAAPYAVDNTGNVVGDTRVYKAGRTTGWTEGSVTAIGVASNVQYSGGLAGFRNQIAIQATTDNSGPFSDRGDSGSGIWNSGNELIGLLYAGSTTRTLANPIDLVMSEITNVLNQGPLTLV